MTGQDPTEPERSVHLVTRINELWGLKTEWTRLLLDCQRPNIFLSWEWMMTWLRTYNRSDEPYVLLLRRSQDQALEGLAPLLRRPRRSPVGLQTIRFMGTGVGADHLAFLARRGVEAQVYAGLARHLLLHSHWDNAELLRLEENFAAHLIETIRGHRDNGWAFSASLADECPFIHLPQTWEDFQRVVHRKGKRDLARQWRRLQEQGQVHVHRIQTSGDLQEGWRILVRLHKARRQALGGRSSFVALPAQTFHEEFSRVALAQGWLRLYLLRVGEQCVAADYCLRLGNCVTGFQSGFDMSWSRYGVGTLLRGHAIAQAIAEGATEFDFLRGAEPYKISWGATSRRNTSLSVWKRRSGVELVLTARRWAAQMKHRFRKV